MWSCRAKDGLVLPRRIESEGIQTPVVMVSGQAKNRNGRTCARLGDGDFREKRSSNREAFGDRENTSSCRGGARNFDRLKKQAGKQELVWKSAVMQTVWPRGWKRCGSEKRVCILRRKPVRGKELVAHTLHDKSTRHAARSSR